jgi:ATP-dependent DNA ligase
VAAGDGWLHELKHDGFRIIAHKDSDEVRLWSRNGRNWSVEFVVIAAALRELPGAFMLDGEAVAHCPQRARGRLCLRGVPTHGLTPYERSYIERIVSR